MQGCRRGRVPGIDVQLGAAVGSSETTKGPPLNESLERHRLVKSADADMALPCSPSSHVSCSCGLFDAGVCLLTGNYNLHGESIGRRGALFMLDRLDRVGSKWLIARSTEYSLC